MIKYKDENGNTRLMHIKGPEPDPYVDTEDDGVTGGVYAVIIIVCFLLLGLY